MDDGYCKKTNPYFPIHNKFECYSSSNEPIALVYVNWSIVNGQECEGNCYDDSDCASGLKCLIRYNGAEVPGCKTGGEGDSSYTNYRYDPTSTSIYDVGISIKFSWD